MALESGCYGECAKHWPPVRVNVGALTAGQGIDASLLTTIRRKTGELQAAYNGLPLYYFFKDQAPGDTNGQGVLGSGAKWYLVSPKGQIIK